MKQKIGDKNFIQYVSNGKKMKKVNDILCSWNKCVFKFPEKTGESQGFRSAQLGAIYAIKSHWTVSNSAATMLMRRKKF